MTIAQEFEYLRPQTLDEAVEILAGADGSAMVLAGGTDLVAWLRDELIAPDLVVDIKEIAGLSGITDRGDSVGFGALVTLSDLLESDLVGRCLPLFPEMARTFASVGIRHRATLAGNICSAVPSCDAGPVLLVYEALVHAVGVSGERVIPIGEWFVGPKQTVLSPGEIVAEISVPRPDGVHGGAFVRLSRYQGEDLAQASVAVLALEGHRYRVAFGAVAPTPLRAHAIEARLSGNPLTSELIEAATELVAETISPITDLRASQEYRMHMCRVMLQRGLTAAVARREGRGPAYGTALV